MATRKATSAGRFYVVDGHELPSVTNVLSVISKPALVKWAETQARAATTDAAADLYIDATQLPKPLSRASYIAALDARLGASRVSDRLIQKAQEIGSQTHALIEWTLRQQLGQAVGARPAATLEAELAFGHFTRWAESVQLTPLEIEQTVWHVGDGYAGTMDLLAEVNGVRSLIDFKTGKSVYAEAFLQNVAYQEALRSMGHGDVAQGLIVRLPKHHTDPSFDVVTVPACEALYPVFMAALRLWHWWSEEEQKSKAAWAAKKRQQAQEVSGE